MHNLKSHLKDTNNEEDPEIFNLGICGFNEAYKMVHNTTAWNVHDFLHSVFLSFS